ncbi:MAG TPA: hypothetical protein VN324_06250 [Quisquiliibacterium sp.]|nr:hypothetical protein [Quisquiliibacterium sp.]
MSAPLPLLTFERFTPGVSLGEYTEAVDERMLEHWATLYPWDLPSGDSLPAGLATVLLMRAYMQTLAPRPPGNMHARQHLEMAAAPRRGESVTTAFTCAGKELRRERRYVEVDTRSTGEGGRLLFTGRMTLIWAA